MRAPTSNARSPFPWFGGKQRLAERIAALLPPHDVYVEVFGGGASVLFTKPKSQLEVYNDLSEGLVTFFRVLRDRPEELVAKLELTPYSRSEFERCRNKWRDVDDEVEQARRWFVIVSQSFGAVVWNGGWKHLTAPSHGRGWGGERLGRLHLSRSESTANRVDHIWRFVDRLRGVQIEDLDWRDCFDRYDAATTLFYVDPPYVPDTRRGGRYEHELSEDDHRELVERLLTLEGLSIVSGYEHALYQPLEDAGFTRIEFDARATAAKMVADDEERHGRTEVIWAKAVSEPSLFGEAVA